MRDASDMELLREYARQNSEAAFAELVCRHINLVYSAALRHVGIAAQAEEITQAVFVILARKAASLREDQILDAWLFETTRLTALSFLRGERRRQFREQEAYMQSILQESTPDPVWQQLAPLLDDAMMRLGRRDREAVVLRFFKGRSLGEVAAALNIKEPAAQKCVSRALEKLRHHFARRGVDSTAAVIGETISASSIQAAPVTLAKTVTAVAIAKGAAASASTLTLIKGALKIMAWTKVKTTIVAGVIVLLAAGTATVTFEQIEQHKNAVQSQVLEIIRTNSWNYLSDNTELHQIVAIGPEAIPVFSNLVVWREPTKLRPDEKFFASLPAIERRRLQDIRVRRQMHQKAVQIVYELGPAAARPLTGLLSGVLNNEHDWQVTTYAMRALYWSIPESTTAIAAVTNWLSDPTHQHLFGTTDSDALWPDLPNVTPLLAQCLRNPHLAREAAIGLGIIGTNAVAAVPELIEVCDQGAAGPPLGLNFHVAYQSSTEPTLMNRQAALEALGKIGDASPVVLAAIERGLADTNESIRFAVLGSLAALHQPLAGRLPEVLNTFTPRRSISFQKIIEWTGTLGADGHGSLPWLRRFDTLDKVQKLPEGIHDNTGDFVIDPDYFRLSAMVAICRIEPEATRQYLPDLAAQIGQRWEPVELLLDTNTPRSLVPDIVAGLEPVLGDTNGLRSAIAAYVILGLEPEHKRALTTLRNATISGELYNRIIASGWLWKRTGDTNSVLTLCAQGLASSESFIGQDAAQVLEEMGPAARPAVPALQTALWHQDRYVREYTGKALRKIAPEEMPQIH
jgi:RNA polymerase sigma factor (sigma-70 family)